MKLPRRFGESARRAWAWIRTNEVQLKIVFSVLAGLYILVEYSLKSHEAKVEKTLRYVERSTQFEVAAARKKLDAFWYAKPASEWRKVLNRENYNEIVPKLMEKEGLMGEIKVLSAFYTELALCVNRGICAGETACQFFFEDVQGFRHNYKWHLDELETGWKESGGTAINEMLAKSCTRDVLAYCSKIPASPYCKKTGV